MEKPPAITDCSCYGIVDTSGSPKLAFLFSRNEQNTHKMRDTADKLDVKGS